jgi:ribitol 2-dehydrogenase
MILRAWIFAQFKGVSTMANELEGKIAVVTGATQGIGLACLEKMVEAGAVVVAVARSRDKLEALHKKHGDAVIPLAMDLLDLDACVTLVPRILAETGRIDTFLANAGMYIGGRLVDNDPKAIADVATLNYIVPMLNMNSVLPHMIKNKEGDFVAITSLAAKFPTLTEPVYASSKTGLSVALDIVRNQVCEHNIRIMEVAPGPVETPLIAGWEPERLQAARESGALIPSKQIAEAVVSMLKQPRNVSTDSITIRPNGFEIYKLTL